MSDELSLPIIDISPWLEEVQEDEKKERVCKDVNNACCEWGFFIITGLPTTFTESILPNAANQSRQFFASPLSTKQPQNTDTATATAYGYFGMESESLTNENDNNNDSKKLPDLREAWSMGPVTPMSNRLLQLYNNNNNHNNHHDDGMYREVIDFCYQKTPWPLSSSSFQSSLTDFYVETSNIGRVVLQIIARCLDLPETYFQQASMEGEHCNSARAIWYPKLQTKAKHNQYRCGPHTDSGVLTLLWTDGLGLEIQTTHHHHQQQHGSSLSWIPITNLPTNSLLINIGDLLQQASGQKWRSTPHRVLAPKLNDTLYNQNRLVLVLFLLMAADFPIPQMDMTQGEYLYRQFQKWKQD